MRTLSSYRTKSKLTERQPLEIYALKMSGAQGTPQRCVNAVSAMKVASMYGVSDKAVRDIWNGRTWLRETAALDDPAEAATRLAARFRNRRAASTESVDQFHGQGGHPSPADPEPLPCHWSDTFHPQFNSDGDDPFHDDWPYWTQNGV